MKLRQVLEQEQRFEAQELEQVLGPGLVLEPGLKVVQVEYSQKAAVRLEHSLLVFLPLKAHCQCQHYLSC